MKRLRWPRPPLILGFVLGKLVERYMFISVERYGADFLLHPFVLGMFALTLYGILNPVVRGYLRSRKASRTRRALKFQPDALNTDSLFAVILCALFVVALVVSAQWPFGARLVPQVVCWTGLAFLVLHLFMRMFFVRVAPTGGAEAQALAAAQIPGSEGGAHFDIQADYGDLSRREIFIRATQYFGWCLFYLALAAVIGLLFGSFVFLIAYMWIEGRERWRTNLIISVTTVICCYLLFHMLLHVAWPQALIGDLFPQLRSIQSLNLF
jgi:hypothetical protein